MSHFKPRHFRGIFLPLEKFMSKMPRCDLLPKNCFFLFFCFFLTTILIKFTLELEGSHIGSHFGCLDFLCLQLVDLHISNAFRHETLQIQLSWVFLKCHYYSSIPLFSYLLQITFGFSDFQSFKTYLKICTYYFQKREELFNIFRYIGKDIVLNC